MRSLLNLLLTCGNTWIGCRIRGLGVGYGTRRGRCWRWRLMMRVVSEDLLAVLQDLVQTAMPKADDGPLAAASGAALRSDPRVHWPAVWALYGWLGVTDALDELRDRGRTAEALLPPAWSADRSYLLAQEAGLDGATELRHAPPHMALDLEINLGLPTVVIEIAGCLTRWVVDTGSSTSVLDRDVADRLGVSQPYFEREVTDSAGRSVAIVPATVEGAWMGDVPLPAVPCAALHLPSGDEIDGVLAVADLCTHAVVELDLGKSRLQVLPAELAEAPRGVSLPVRRVDDVPTIDCDVAGRSVSLMIDTGAVTDLIDPSLIDELDLSTTPTAAPPSPGGRRWVQPGGRRHERRDRHRGVISSHVVSRVSLPPFATASRAWRLARSTRLPYSAPRQTWCSASPPFPG